MSHDKVITGGVIKRRMKYRLKNFYCNSTYMLSHLIITLDLSVNWVDDAQRVIRLKRYSGSLPSRFYTEF